MKSNDKKRARLEALRYVLSVLDYDEKDHGTVGTPDPLIIRTGPHPRVFEADEQSDRLFPTL